jgi:hypothetical protein
VEMENDARVPRFLSTASLYNHNFFSHTCKGAHKRENDACVHGFMSTPSLQPQLLVHTRANKCMIEKMSGRSAQEKMRGRAGERTEGMELISFLVCSVSPP